MRASSYSTELLTSTGSGHEPKFIVSDNGLGGLSDCVMGDDDSLSTVLCDQSRPMVFTFHSHRQHMQSIMKGGFAHAKEDAHVG